MQAAESVFFDKLADSWDETREKNERKLRELIEVIGLCSGESVLDVGSGTGVLLPYIRQFVGTYGKITAVDFSPNMLERARAKYRHFGNISFCVGDIMEMPVAELYDKVVCLNFFPHMKDKPGFLVQMRRHLKADGVLVIMHDISRAQVNGIHGKYKEVAEDRLPPATIVAAWLRQSGYAVGEVIDRDDRYFIKAMVTE
ncbi:MAG TPA: class I SAM-dependent methyltransferase [Patescibacteria group bacterium]|nr:class I SAM-dependent methyltransferase [Patescibacteria group bacterium]